MTGTSAMTRNLPADLPGLALAIEANLAEERRIREAAAAEYRAISTRTLRQMDPVRLERGRLLLAARDLVATREWKAWCDKHVKHSASDIRALIKLAKAADPEAAVEAEKARARDGMAKLRAARAAEASAVTSECYGAPAAKPVTSPPAITAVPKLAWPTAEPPAGVSAQAIAMAKAQGPEAAAMTFPAALAKALDDCSDQWVGDDYEMPPADAPESAARVIAYATLAVIDSMESLVDGRFYEIPDPIVELLGGPAYVSALRDWGVTPIKSGKPPLPAPAPPAR